MSDCIFCKIIAGDIPSGKVFEDDDVLVFHDIHPFARVHFLIIPKAHIASLADCGAAHEKILGKMLALAPKLAKEQGLDAGFKTLINTGRGGGQEVFHIHIHVFGGGDPAPRN
ncbi:MAG: histidine triad nucleotide-binding protein [Thiobacillaceae bacterium]